MSKEFSVVWYDGHGGNYSSYYVQAPTPSAAYKKFITALCQDMKQNGYVTEIHHRDIYVQRPGSDILPQIKREWLVLSNIEIINESEEVYHLPTFDKDGAFIRCSNGEKYNDYTARILKRLRKEAKK